MVNRVEVVTEVERKFEAGEGFQLPDLTVLPGVATATPPEVHELDATYFDTRDLRLLHNGITLRRRTGGRDAGWHLKLPKGDGVRDEVRLPAGRSASRVPADLLSRVQVHLRGVPPIALVRLRTRRIVQQLVNDAGDDLAEVAQDHVNATLLSQAPESSVTIWSELEVELTGGSRQLLERISDRLTAAGAVPGTSASKLGRALAEQLEAPPPPGRGGAPARSAGAVVLDHLADHVGRLKANDPLVRQDAPDAVHQMRVATRRLRSALATFRPLFDRAVTDPLRDELAWLGGVLGEARDAEVIRDRVRDLLSTVPGDLVLGPVQARVVTGLGTRYRSAHDAVLAALDGARYHALLDALDGLLADPPLTGAAFAKRDAVLLPLVAKTYRRMRRLHERALAETRSDRRDALLHEVRKAAKRARYAAEALAPRYGKRATAWAARMEDLQETLGAHQDGVVIRDRIRDLAVAAHLDGENGFTYGLLYCLERDRSHAAEQDYQAVWARAAKRSLHRWLTR